MQQPIFITARFRSGSTMLWNIFDRNEKYCAYYEPLHDNLLAHVDYTKPMKAHRGVDDYWRAYRPILEEVRARHTHEFGITRMLLEEDDPWPELAEYIACLIEAAGDRRAVLQFNRIDLRLPWIRRNFPDAVIVHLHRNARDSFASMVQHLRCDEIDDPNRQHLYDTLEWSVDLAAALPFLVDPRIETLYERTYLLWKLSMLMGSRRSHLSLSYEDDFSEGGERGLRALARRGLLEESDLAAAAEVIDPPASGGWRSLHDEAWFETIEARCEQVLNDRGLNEQFGRIPLADIRQTYPDAWRDDEEPARTEALRLLQGAYSRQRSEVTRLLYLVRRYEGEP